MNIIKQLQRDEGLRLTAYPDPVSGKEPYTIGYGHTEGVELGDVITKEQAYAYLLEDIEEAEHDLNFHLGWVADLDDVRYFVLVNMCFNLGISRLLKFKNTLAFIKDGQYYNAGMAMLQSKWAKQVKHRANRLSQQMITGKWH